MIKEIRSDKPKEITTTSNNIPNLYINPTPSGSRAPLLTEILKKPPIQGKP